ncbi:prolipoprotein diacylglyceryl transferase family protein [Ornithinimicrobium pratense]|uniref:prolipoprotein diacylglyceryl transferase family protein n=1 Tax=Ornithinimicrobium pratense TaxID=2593973 RepID=UPI001EE27229|nr:prolipoprotein diacylglyceryl transferase family protein [Ornithinimicrobium pratense]
MLLLTDLAHLVSDPGALVASSEPLRWDELGLRQGIEIGPLMLRFYSLAYLAGILGGYWLLARMIRRPGSPMDRDQLDTLILGLIIGIIGGAGSATPCSTTPACSPPWTCSSSGRAG